MKLTAEQVEEISNHCPHHAIIDRLHKNMSIYKGVYRYRGRAGQWEQFYRQLWYIIREYSVEHLRAWLKAMDCYVPHLYKNEITNNYYIRRKCAVVYIDDVETFADRTAPDIANNYLMYNYAHRGLYFYSETPTIYGNYPLSLWIRYGTVCSRNDHHYHLEGERCQECEQENQPLSYNTAVETLLGFEETKERLFGIELEYEDVQAIDVYTTLKGYAVPKRDGTIHNGVEVVTQPASINKHKTMLRSFFEAIETHAATNTGMHVHVDRSRLTELHIGSMLEFINNDDNYIYIEQIAGRDFKNNRYCRQDSKIKAWHGLRYNNEDHRYYRQSHNRYTALNLDKRTTIEFRIFRSPESYEECCAKLSFVDAIVDFCNPYTSKISFKERKTWAAFKEYVLQHLKQYHDLVTYYSGVFA